MVHYIVPLVSLLTVVWARANGDGVLARREPTMMKVCNGDSCMLDRSPPQQTGINLLGFNAYRHSTGIASPFCNTYVQSTVTETVTPLLYVFTGP